MTTWLYIAVGLALAALALWLLWRIGKARGWFAGSETIFVARIVTVLGAVGSVIAVTPVEPILKALGLGPWAPFVMLVIGIAVEVARKLRTEGGVLGNDLTPKP